MFQTESFFNRLNKKIAMNAAKIVSGDNEEDIWKQIESQFRENPEPLGYDVIIENQGRTINISIDEDMGGGFEGGYAITSLTAQLEHVDGFRFALHRQDFIDQLGKFLGMEDIELGYPEFDKDIIVKTNDAERLKSILGNEKTRSSIQSLRDFNFHISHHSSVNTEVEAAFLELTIDDAILETTQLRSIYELFVAVLNSLDNENSSIIKFL